MSKVNRYYFVETSPIYGRLAVPGHWDIRDIAPSGELGNGRVALAYTTEMAERLTALLNRANAEPTPIGDSFVTLPIEAYRKLVDERNLAERAVELHRAAKERHGMERLRADILADQLAATRIELRAMQESSEANGAEAERARRNLKYARAHILVALQSPGLDSVVRSCLDNAITASRMGDDKQPGESPASDETAEPIPRGTLPIHPADSTDREVLLAFARHINRVCGIPS